MKTISGQPYRAKRVATVAVMVLMVSAMTAAVAAAQDDGDKLKISGDFRLRLEADFDSQRANGTEREDRNRTRIRARVGLDWKPLERLSFGFRLRSGSDLSQQSPHITVIDFDDNDTGDAEFNFDKWFVRGSRDRVWGWVGRNSLPFWKQNEMFWDDDTTPAGLAGGWGQAVGDNGKVSLSLGYFSLPAGMKQFSGNLGLGQLVYTDGSDRVGFTLAAGLLEIEGDPNDPDAAILRNGNGIRDYSILVGSAQVKGSAGGRPLVFGVDYLDNGERYTANDPFAFANRDETDGFVVSIQWGSTSNKGDWLVGYWYAEIGTLAVNASYAQDDWVRWGSATQTDSSDFEGHELRFAYSLGKVGNLVARLYLVDAITSQQDGKRFRLDYNVRF